MPDFIHWLTYSLNRVSAKSSRAKGARSLGRKPARSRSASVSKTLRKDAGGDATGVDSAASSGLPQSAGCTPKKVDMRARYWAFLFDNLRRAVDAIYETCESDESVIECKVSWFYEFFSDLCPCLLCFESGLS